MHILIVSQYFWPENFRINDLGAELVARGHQITVLTGKPNYPSGELFSEYKKSPELFTEYEGCEIIRVPLVLRGKGKNWKLALNYISFVFSASLIGYRKIKRHNFDIIFVYEPSPVTVCLPAIFIKKLRKIPIVFWVQDLWPETLEAVGIIKSPRLVNWVGKLVAFIYNRCDLILGQSKAFYGGIASYCKDSSKIGYLPNWSEDNLFPTDHIRRVNEIIEDSAAFKILFAGNIGEAQDLPSVVKAMKLIQENRDQSIRLFIVGDGRALESIKKLVSEYRLEDKVKFLGRHPLTSMPSFFASVDALVVTLKDSPVFSATIPSKVQAYMSAGKPILSMLTGEGSRVINEAKCGLTALSSDYSSLANNIIQMSLYSNEQMILLGKNAKKYSDKEFNRELLISRLERWLREVAEGKKVTL